MSHSTARCVLILATMAASWWGMQIVHELGHILSAWLTGGTVTNVVLHPLAISRTNVMPNPHPLLVVWGGPLVGVVLPLVGFAIARRFVRSTAYLLRFFAGFCCVANGAYIGMGVFFPVGDAQVMRAAGAAGWGLALFGAITIPLGFALWNGLSPAFGLGPAAKGVNHNHAIGMTILSAGIVIGELAFA